MAVDAPLTILQLAAVTGIAFVWANFTVKAFKLGWHIVSLAQAAKVPEDAATQWLIKQALWQIYLPAP